MNKSFDILQILNAIYRRRDVAIAFATLVMALTIYVVKTLPDIYRSSTLILVTPQRLPANYVASTVTTTIEQRMQAIAQQVLSRTTLESVIKELKLFNPDATGPSMELQVAMMRKRLNLSINRNDTFTLSFDSENPEEAQRVTARLASLFIDENVKVREQQAAGTTGFISAEAERLRKELEEHEAKVNQYRAKNWYELPENRDNSYRALDQLHRELESSVSRASSLQDRKAALEKQIVESEMLEREMTGLGKSNGQSLPIDRNEELDKLLLKYSEKHPDVIRLKREIEAARSEPVPSKYGEQNSVSTKTFKSKLGAALASQLKEIIAEAASLHATSNKIRAQMALLQARLDNVPLRAVELSRITRDYDITLRKYQDLLAKTLESELSENMEKKQKGEQFQIVDRARVPQEPVAPNRARILLIGFLLAVGGGLGGAFLLDALDKSFKSNEELAGYINIPVLGVLPALVTQGSIREQRRARMLVVFGSLGVFIIGMALTPYVGAFLIYR